MCLSTLQVKNVIKRYPKLNAVIPKEINYNILVSTL